MKEGLTHMQNMIFESRAAFRTWLETNESASEGMWLLFGKAGGVKTLSAAEALEEALCFGWIDGQMQRIDDTCYRKYFAPRRKDSKWSEKNKKLAGMLEEKGLMTDRGRAAISEAKANGQWDAPKAPPVTEEDIASVEALLEGHEPALSNFRAMSPSVRKTYTKAMLAAKTPEGREKQLARIIDRLNQNLKPM